MVLRESSNFALAMTIKDFHKAAIITPEHEVSYAELMQYIKGYAMLMKGTLNDGVSVSGTKKKVLIFSENREEWVYAFFAIWYNGDIAVTVDATATVPDVAYIMKDSGADAIWVSPTTESVAREAIAQAGIDIRVLAIDGVEKSTEPVEAQMVFEADPNATTPLEKTTLIIYTSGTTGSPKGVMLSYENLEANIRSVSDEVPIFNVERRTLMLLPVHHVLPLMGSVIAPITRGGGIAICPTMTGPDIMNMLCRGQIAIFIGVPRLWQTLYTGIKKKIDEKWITRTLFNICFRLQNRTLSRFIFQSVHKKMGGHLDYCVSGGAALDREIGYGLKALGLDVLEGYGMTETAPIIAFTRPGDYIPGCSGKPLPSVEVKIVNGELCAKGDNLMLGYYNRPEETAQVIDKDGFLHTGDLASIDEEGRVYITGRTKEIIVLSNGKNVQPNEIEFQLEKFDTYVKEAAVTENADQLVAIIVPKENVNGGQRPLTPSSLRGGVNYPNNYPEEGDGQSIEQLLKEKVIQPYNRSVENYKKIMKIVVYEGDLPRTKLDKLQRFKLKEIVNGNVNVNGNGVQRPLTPSSLRGGVSNGNGSENLSPVEAAVTKFIAAEKHCDVRLTDHIETDLALDSLDKVSLQSYIEETFGVSVNADEMADFGSIADMCKHITEESSGNGNGGQRPLTPSSLRGGVSYGNETLASIDWHDILVSSSASAASTNDLPSTKGIHAFMHSLYAKLFNAYFRSNNRLTIKGMENVPAEGPAIIAPNHQSYFDGALAVCGMSWKGVRDYYFYATEEHVNTNGRRWMAKRHNVIIMERKNLKTSILKMAEVLQAGKRVVIFPEGSRTFDGSLSSFKKTFAILAKELNVPIVPVCIKGAYEAMPRGRVLPTPHHITVEYLPQVNVAADAELKDKSYDEIAQKVQGMILSCLNSDK